MNLTDTPEEAVTLEQILAASEAHTALQAAVRVWAARIYVVKEGLPQGIARKELSRICGEMEATWRAQTPQNGPLSGQVEKI